MTLHPEEKQMSRIMHIFQPTLLTKLHLPTIAPHYLATFRNLFGIKYYISGDYKNLIPSFT